MPFILGEGGQGTGTRHPKAEACRSQAGEAMLGVPRPPLRTVLPLGGLQHGLFAGHSLGGPRFSTDTQTGWGRPTLCPQIKLIRLSTPILTLGSETHLRLIKSTSAVCLGTLERSPLQNNTVFGKLSPYTPCFELNTHTTGLQGKETSPGSGARVPGTKTSSANSSLPRVSGQPS